MFRQHTFSNNKWNKQSKEVLLGHVFCTVFTGTMFFFFSAINVKNYIYFEIKFVNIFILQFFALLLIVFALEVTAGVLGYVYKDKVQNFICFLRSCFIITFPVTSV